MKLYKEDGQLSDHGKQIFQDFIDDELKALFNGASNENEIRLIGSLIQKRVGDLISDYVQLCKK